MDAKIIVEVTDGTALITKREYRDIFGTGKYITAEVMDFAKRMTARGYVVSVTFA